MQSEKFKKHEKWVKIEGGKLFEEVFASWRYEHRTYRILFRTDGSMINLNLGRDLSPSRWLLVKEAAFLWASLEPEAITSKMMHDAFAWLAESMQEARPHHMQTSSARGKVWES